MKILIVMNPRARRGIGRGFFKSLKEKLGDPQIDLCYGTSPKSVRATVATAEIDGYDMVIAVGGDGTVNEVINGMAGCRVPLGIIPAGTANDLANHYGLPHDTQKAIEILSRNNICELDLARVNGRYYSTAGGIGLPSEVADTVNSIRVRGGLGRFLARVLGSLVYIFVTLRAISRRKNQHNIVAISCNGRTRVMDALAVMVANQPRLGKRFKMSPDANNHDGLLDICLIENSKNRLQVLGLFVRILRGTHVNLPWVSIFRAARLTIRSEKPEAYFGDGEILDEKLLYDIEVRPRALRLLVPSLSGARYAH
jgi:YegS/Rv2252/BmrU family lipid kinase